MLLPLYGFISEMASTFRGNIKLVSSFAFAHSLRNAFSSYFHSLFRLEIHSFIQAIHYVTMSFVAFTAVNGALLLIGFIFIVHSLRGEHADESRTMQDLYLVALLLAAVEAIGNPVCFVNRIHKVRSIL